MNKKIGFISLLLAAACFGSFGVWIRLLSTEMTIYQQIVFRNILAFLMAVFIIIVGKRHKLDLKKVPLRNILLYAIVVPISVIFYNVGMLSQKIAIVTFAFYIGTIFFSELIGALIFKEKLTTIRLAALALVIVGLGCFIYPFSMQAISIGFLASVASGFFDAAGNGFRRDLAGKLDKFMLVLLTAVGGIVVSGLMMVYAKQPLDFLGALSLQSWIVGIAFGLILTLVNFLLLVGFQNFEIGPGVITLSSELFFALIFGFVIFREMPLTKELIGGLCIVAGAIIPNINWNFLKEKRVGLIDH